MDVRSHYSRESQTEIRDFVPPFCPYPECADHLLPEGTYTRFERRGFRKNARKPGLERRYRCKACGHWFSSSSFFIDYWTKIPGLEAAMYRQLCEGSGLRQVSRCIGIPHTTLYYRQHKARRKVLLLDERAKQELRQSFREPLGLDALRTYAGSKYEPDDVHTLIGCESHYWIEIGGVPLRRSGSMSEMQKAIREERDEDLGKPDPKIVKKVLARMMAAADSVTPPSVVLELRTDEQVDYERAVKQLRKKRPVEHVTVSSKEWRERSSHPLWSINHAHRLTRHAIKSQTRRTLAYHKNFAGLMGRMLAMQTWRNWTKGISERDAEGRKTTPAMLLKLTDRPLSGEDLFFDRLFPRREGLPPDLVPLYEGTITARPGEKCRPYRLKTLFAY